MWRAALLALALLTCGAYRAVWTAGYVYEDQNFAQSLTQPLAGWSDPRLSLVHPRVLTDLSFTVNAAFGAGARGYHLTNLALHLYIGLCVAVLLASWGAPWGGVFAAGVLWLHPMQTETVAYLGSGRGELLATLLVLVALWAMLDRRYVLAASVGLLALMAKESTAAGLVALWPLLLVWRTGAVPRRAWGVIGSVGACVLLVGATFLARTPHVWHLGLASGRLLGDALRVVLPMGQAVDHGALPLSGAAQALTAGAVWLLLVASVWPSRTWRWAVLSVTACLLPRLLMPQAELPHEHAWYLPLALLAMATGVSMSRLFQECAWPLPTARPSTSLTRRAASPIRKAMAM